MKQRLKAIQALAAVQKRLERTVTREALLELAVFFIHVIESRTWGFFRTTAGG